MKLEQEVQNFNEYKQEVLKLVKYVSLNRKNLTLHLLVKSYNYVKALGHKYCDKTNDDLQANYIDGMPDWDDKDCREGLTLDDYWINYNSDNEPYREYYNYTAIINPYLVGVLFNGDFRSDPESYGSMVFKLGKKHGLKIVKEVGMYGRNTTKYTIEDFIDYLKVLADILQLNITYDRKTIKKIKQARKHASSNNNSSHKSSNKPIDYAKIEKEHAKAIRNGAYSWNNIFN